MSIASLKRLVFIYSIIRNSMLVYMVYAIMFTERGGLSVAGANVMFAVWTIATLVAEVPTGLFADRYSRKMVIVLSELLRALGFVVWLVSPTIWGYGVGYAIWAVGFSLFHGGFEALLYDELASRHREKDYVRLTSLNMTGMYVGYTVGTLVVYLISRGNPPYTAILWQSIGMSIVAAGIALLFPSAPKRAHESHALLMKSAIALIRSTVDLRWLLIWTALVIGLANWFEEYMALFYRTLGFSVRGVMIAMIIGLAAGIVLSLYLHRVHIASMFIKIGLFFIALICMAVAASVGDRLIAVAATIIFYRTVSGLEVLFDASLQDKSASQVRATISSIAGMVGYVFSIAIIFIFVGLLRHMHTGRALFVMALIMGIGAILVLPKYSHKKIRKTAYNTSNE